MNNSNIFIAIACLLIGALLAWIIRKLVFEKNSVSIVRLLEANEKIQQLNTQKAVIEQMLQQVEAAREKSSEKLATKENLYAELAKEHASKLTFIDGLSENNKNLCTEINQLKLAIESKSQELNSANIQIADKNSKLQHQQEQQLTHKTELEEMGEKLKKDFQILANTILDEKSQKFTQLNSANLKTILDPLKKDLGEFKTRVEETYDKESKERFSLGERIKDLVELNHKISDEAHNLTKALKGEVKKQGDWGEMILESVLEHSGLVKDREYYVQAFIRDDAGNIIKNEEGQAMKPDVLIYYPDKRCLVVDSKVSLNAYERFANADDKETQEKELANHTISLRSHIDGLSAKNYQNYVDSLDWVVMFVPIEPAYLVALRKDSGLWNYAYSKRIIMVCPSNLMAVLKITSDLWKREYHNQNALDIAKRGGQLYDKFVGFVTTMQDLGVMINRAQNTYEKAFGQLTTGSGNLVRQAELMKKLEIKATKQLPDQLIIDAMDDETTLIESKENLQSAD